MRRVLPLALACAGCLSDLAVGTSVRAILEDAATPVDAGELDAGLEDASKPELDAGPPIIFFTADASQRRDGSASADVYPVLCKPTLCTLFLVAVQCEDAGKAVCAQPSASETCQYLCL